jgi:hypothetical protein
VEAIMTTQDQDQAHHERNDSWRRELVERFGEDILVGLPTDPAPTGKPTRSAQLYGRRRDQAMRARRLTAAKETISTAAALDADRRAYDRVLDQAQEGHPVSPADLLAAERHAKRHGLVPVKTSAEKMADLAGRS